MTPLMATFVDATPAPGTGVGVVAAGSLPAQAPVQAVQAAPGVSGVSGGWPGLVSSCSDSELVVRIGEWERRIRLARKHQLELIAEADRRRLHAVHGARSTQVWLVSLLNIDGAEATTRVRIATATHTTAGDDTPEADTSSTDTATGASVVRMPVTGQALGEGVIGVEHAKVISRCLTKLPAHLRHRAGEVERLLVEHACSQSPRTLAKLADRVRYMLDGDGAVRDEHDQHEARELHYATTRDGMLVLKARLDRETGAKFVTALQPLAAPRPETDGVKDLRTVGQRNADGLVTLLDLALDHDGMPRVGGQRPHLTVTINYTDLQQQIHTRINDTTSSTGGAGMLEYTGQYLSPQAIRRIACDCEVLPMVLGGDSLPLDVGMSQRTAPAHLRAALLARDGVCAFPGCDQPPGTPQAHHIRHWIDGGPTALDNMVMLCAHHHRTIHHHHWHITLHQGRPVFTPPERIDPTRTPQPGATAQPTTHHHALTQLTPPRPPGDTTPHHPTH